ncbi:hypothetical protein [Paenibacillus oryzisoli]|uniref:Uncharacterized protein n=1 Tax=Paenibacillus oryzisoli TaxID=1850517 RepID=A0A198AN56_9BACL|nr:hypothetical protein [Paenibacillus oryzisoli]OAS22328.1 hypothetical protein A8708_12205 [Paenibacillus oryzisoli]
MKKNLISKNKLIGTIASTAVLAAPLVLAPSQYSYATTIGDSPPVVLDKIHTIVLPQNGVKYLDFKALYQADYVNITMSGSNKVKAGYSFWDEGIYEVRALDIGDATFTVSGIGHSDEQEGYVNFTDTFKVSVVANTANPDAYKFDITKAFDLLVKSTQSKDNTIAILQNIAPETVGNTEPFSYNIDNSPPYQITPTSPSVLQAEVGVPIDQWSINYQIGNYFSDDYSNLCYGEEEGEEGGEITRSCLSLVSVESNANINVTPIYEGETLVDQEVVPVTEGIAYLDVIVTDHEGGFTKGHIPIHVNPYVAAPQFKPTSVVANHFRMPDVSSTLYLSNDAEIDLNEIFYSEGDLDYSVSVDYGLYTPHTATLYLDNDASKITWSKLNELLTQQMGTTDTVRNIRGITAVTSNKETNIDVNIQHTTIDPFPASIDMYQSNNQNNPALTSSYILNYKSDQGFNGNKMLVTPSDIQNNTPISVTAYVYENNYLKFDFANEINPNISKVKVYAHDSIPGNLYLDDFNFRLVSPAQTPLANTNIPTVHIKSLYPEVSDTYWANRAGELGNFVTSERIQDVFLEYWKDPDTQVVTVTAVFRYEAAQGAGVQLNIDPFNGTKVFQVPFIKP